jgi:hypothetical protein
MLNSNRRRARQDRPPADALLVAGPRSARVILYVAGGEDEIEVALSNALGTG